MPYAFTKVNLLILKQLHEREQRKDVIWGKVIFLCGLESFIPKSLQDRKKLQTNCSMTIAYN